MVRPSIVLCSGGQSFEMGDWITNAVNTLKPSQQQFVLREFIRRVYVDTFVRCRKTEFLISIRCLPTSIAILDPFYWKRE